jgi:hypothetical protein
MRLVILEEDLPCDGLDDCPCACHDGDLECEVIECPCDACHGPMEGGHGA